jgi:serine/threonine-protein kinase RsbW
MLAAFADAVNLDGRLFNDAATAISEACNNVVLHAYKGRSGPLTVWLGFGPEGLEAVVTDRGAGLTRAPPRGGSLGLGLGVIAALADRAEFRSRDQAGTQVRMTFAAPKSKAPPSPRVPIHPDTNGQAVRSGESFSPPSADPRARPQP